MKRWYVLQVYAGYEEAVKADLEKHVRESDMADKFGDVLIPSAKVKSLFESEEAKDKRQVSMAGRAKIIDAADGEDPREALK